MADKEARYKRVSSMQAEVAKIRNVSIIAHVDHGKTTLADCLLASNKIIHKKQAGILRHLDFRQDEIDRGITMKSSTIPLTYNDHLINLIDSPGHTEFSLQVSAALRLTDAALLVVDVVEGISSQTHRVIKQLFEEKLSGILVLNKLDKLIHIVQMDPSRLYLTLSQIIEQVNAILGKFIVQEVASKDQGGQPGTNDARVEALQKMFYFTPEKGNIIFGSALDNWGFTLTNFSPLISNKLGIPSEYLSKHLWGDFYYDPRSKSINTVPLNSKDLPLCVKFILKPICDIFENVRDLNTEKLGNIVRFLNLKTVIGKLNNKLVRQLMNQWLPLDLCVLSSIVQFCPNPVIAQRFRLTHLLGDKLNSLPLAHREALLSCSSSPDAPFIAFVARMLAIPQRNVNERGLNDLPSDSDQKIVGLARVFCGSLKRGESIYRIGPKKHRRHGQQEEPPADAKGFSINNLYYVNAQCLDGVQEIYAGNVGAIGCLDEVIYKSGTLSSFQDCICFAPMSDQASSLLKVSVTTPRPEDNQKMVQGLKKLNMSDPSVNVYVEATGDIILSTCGQVHLEKCIFDLEKIYCKVPIKTSEPIIEFRETITWYSYSTTHNQKYIQQELKKEQEMQKRNLKLKFEAEKMKDALLNENQQVKKKFLEEWHPSVEIYEAQDLTVSDTRYFQHNRDEAEEQEKARALAKRQKLMEVKKFDHKNKGKTHSKRNFINLKMKTNYCSQNTPNQLLRVKVKTVGLCFEVAQWLERTSKTLEAMFCCQDLNDNQVRSKILADRIKWAETFLGKCKEHGVEQQLVDLITNKMISLGPEKRGSNLLLMSDLDSKDSFLQRIMRGELEPIPSVIQSSQGVGLLLEACKLTEQQYINSLVSGFNLACRLGPLCNEPLIGVIFIIESITFVEEQSVPQKKEQSPPQPAEEHQIVSVIDEAPKVHRQSLTQIKQFNDIFGPLSGQIISTVKECCIEAFLGASPRLVEQMYKCEVQTDQRYYGEVYNEFNQRRAFIVSEEVHEISNMFIIKALMPAAESRNFCFKIIDRTQGTAYAQLNLDTWRIYEEDPFYTPWTEEEIEEHGVHKIVYNAARLLLQRIRKKKGLPAIDKIVSAAQKQSTLKKK